MSRPSTATLARVGSVEAGDVLSSVDLPALVGPTIVKNSPSPAVNDTPPSASTLPKPLDEPADRQAGGHAASSRRPAARIDLTGRGVDEVSLRQVGREVDGVALRREAGCRHDPDEGAGQLHVEHVLRAEVLDEADLGRNAGGPARARVPRGCRGPEGQQVLALQRAQAGLELEAGLSGDETAAPPVPGRTVHGSRLIGGSPMNSATKRLTGRW